MLAIAVEMTPSSERRTQQTGSYRCNPRRNDPAQTFPGRFG